MLLSIYVIFIICVGYKNSCLPDSYYFVLSDSWKAKASAEVTIILWMEHQQFLTLGLDHEYIYQS